MDRRDFLQAISLAAASGRALFDPECGEWTEPSVCIDEPLSPHLDWSVFPAGWTIEQIETSCARGPSDRIVILTCIGKDCNGVAFSGFCFVPLLPSTGEAYPIHVVRDNFDQPVLSVIAGVEHRFIWRSRHPNMDIRVSKSGLSITVDGQTAVMRLYPLDANEKLSRQGFLTA